MADRCGQSSRPVETLSGGDGVIWQRQFLFTEQHAGALSRAAIPGDEHSRQRGSGPSTADRGAEDHALARDCGIFDGSAAGFPVGGELPEFCGSHRSNFRNGEDLWSWHSTTGERNNCADNGSGIRERRLQGAAEEGDRSVCDCLDSLAFFARVVAERDVAGGSETGHDLRELCERLEDELYSGGGRQQFDLTDEDLGKA